MHLLWQDSMFSGQLGNQTTTSTKIRFLKIHFAFETCPPQATLETRPTLSDAKTLFGLCCRPWHWFDKINKILHLMALHRNLHDPCMYMGFVIDTTDIRTLLPWSLSALNCMLMTSFISLTAMMAKTNFHIFFLNFCQWISWVLSKVLRD